MKLDDKRKVIEVLLCCAQQADGFNKHVTGETARHLDYGDVDEFASAAWRDAKDDVILLPDHGSHGTTCLEAAYRLIESSPTLVREWFGKERGR